MGYGITAYRTEKALVSEYVFNENRLNKSDEIYDYNFRSFHQIEELFLDKNCISPREALREIFAGNISYTDKYSGAVYRYVAEIAFRVCDIVERLPNDKFFPVTGIGNLTEIFNKYNGFLIDNLPNVDDFPLTAYISNAELKKLQDDYSFLNIDDDCKQQFETWLSVANRQFLNNEGELLLFYY